MSLAPIVLFTYNRPKHTRRILDSLAQNAEAKNSHLFIYNDGPKANATISTLKNIQKTRTIIHDEKRFKEVTVFEQPINKGLANSIIEGVTYVVNKYGKVIVLEDDLIVSPYFLYYINDSLDRYEDNADVGQIGACNNFACGSRFPETFFIPYPDCLGWATWKNRWDHFERDSQKLMKLLIENNLLQKFDAYSSYGYEQMLRDQANNKVDSWAIRWQAVCILKNWLTLYPNPSMTNHIISFSSTNTNINIKPPLCKAKPKLETKVLEVADKILEAKLNELKGAGNYYGKIKMSYKLGLSRTQLINKIPDKLKLLIKKYI